MKIKLSDSGAVETTEKVEKLSTFSSEGDETLEKMEATAESDSGSMFSDFMGFLQNLKLTVTELVSSVSSFLQNIFPSPDTQKMAADADGNIKSSFMGGTFIGLAVLVIMVIVTKRV
ncbi:hypothetical protein V8G54_024940 [Vigna mungo]|uniref:Uncharacterized protein n=1 Tax=Vigna mungo TaxID=3915 RepID=A0AAQ3RQL4_VIGMU